MPSQNLGSKKANIAARDDRGGAVLSNGPYIGIVMANEDPTRMGRVQVWLKTHSSEDRNNPTHWRTVSYLSPFYGVTPHTELTTAESNFDNNGQAYGMWMTAPDVGVEVLCMFVNGDPNKGYYVGYVPEPQMNSMLPAAGAQDTDKVKFNSAAQEEAFAEAKRLPTVEIDKTKEGMNDVKFFDRSKPVHSVIAAQMWQAGTVTDNVRGPIGTSAYRESPSYAYGISTPGRPIYQSGLTEGAIKRSIEDGGTTAKDLGVVGRRGGHSFVMDDGDLEGHDVLMRLRTATGHQITMSDDGAVIYISHANGQSWIELGNEGTVDIYAANSVNLRSQGQLNFHADEDINFYSGRDIRMFAKRNVKMESKKLFDVIGKQKIGLFSEKLIQAKSTGEIQLHSKQDTSIKAEKEIIEQGKKIQMNSKPAKKINNTSSIPHYQLADSFFEEPQGWTSWPGELDTIVTRAPTHEPFADHNKGVPVKVEIAPPPAAAAKKAAETAVKTATVNAATAGPIKPANITDAAGAAAAAAKNAATVAASSPGSITAIASNVAGAAAGAAAKTLADATGNISGAIDAATSIGQAVTNAKGAIKSVSALSSKITDLAMQAIPSPVTPAELVDAKKALGDIAAVGAMGADGVIGAITQRAKDVAQDLGDITQEGIGKFAIKPQQLIDLGVIKKGAVNFETIDPDKWGHVLQDASLFTGAEGINSIDDLLTSEELQGNLVQKGMSFAHDALKSSGVLTGFESASQLAGIVSTTMEAGPDLIKDWVDGTVDSVLGGKLDLLSKASSFANDMADGKAADLLKNAVSGVTDTVAGVVDQVSEQVSGIADTVTGVVDQVSEQVSGVAESINDLVGTVQREGLDSAVDKIIGNIKIPSAASLQKAVQNSIKVASGEINGVIDAAGNIVDAAGNIVAGVTSASFKLPDISGINSDLSLAGIDDLAGKIGDLSGLAGSAFSNLEKISSLTSAGTKLIGQFDGITEEVNNGLASLQGLGGNVVDKLGNIVDSAGNTIGQVQDSAGNIINGAGEIVKNNLDDFKGNV